MRATRLALWHRQGTHPDGFAVLGQDQAPGPGRCGRPPPGHLQLLLHFVLGLEPLAGAAGPVSRARPFRDGPFGLDGSGRFVHNGAVGGPNGGPRRSP